MGKKMLSTTSVVIPIGLDPRLIDVTHSKRYSHDWLVTEAKKKFGWKNLTQRRMKRFIQFVYYLGREGVQPPSNYKFFWSDWPRCSAKDSSWRKITADKKKEVVK